MSVPATNSDNLAPFVCGNVVRYEWVRQPGWRAYICRPLLQPVACATQLKARPYKGRLYCPVCIGVADAEPILGPMPWTVALTLARIIYGWKAP